MTRLLLAFCFCACAIFSNAQNCAPNLSYADSTAGVYPKPYDAATGAGVGITECAVIGQSYEFVFTIVIHDSIVVQGNSSPLDSVIITSVTGMPQGIAYSCEPTNCHFKKNTIGCAKVYGVPTAANAAGDYDLLIAGKAFIPGLPFGIDITFPSTQLAPGKYTIHLNANSTDPCAVSSTRNLEGKVSIATQPNPTAGLTQIKINSQISGQFQMSVVDLLGQQIEKRQISISSGENNVEFDASQLANGLYLVQLQNETGFVSQKIAVQH